MPTTNQDLASRCAAPAGPPDGQTWPWLDQYEGPALRFTLPTGNWRSDDLTVEGGVTLLYRMWTADRQLLYIGITGNPAERWMRHRRTKPWWPDVALIGHARYTHEWKALHAEVRAIRTERPIHNRRSAVA